MVLAAVLPRAALAADGVAGAPDGGLDLGVEQRSSRAPNGSWDWGVGGSAVLPLLEVASHFRLGLRVTDTGRVERLSGHWSIGSTDLTEAQALFWNGRMDRGPNNQVAITFGGGVRLDALAERLGLPRTPWVELGLQSSTVAANVPSGSRLVSTLVLALDFDVAPLTPDGRAPKPASGLRIRASAALGDDPSCKLGAPALLFSGRCLTLAVAVEF